MKRKFLIVFLALVNISCFTFTISACGKRDDGNNSNDVEHTHIAATAVIENEKVANCIESGSYDSVIYCSICGEEMSRETIITDEATGVHSFVDSWSCSVCGYTEVTESEGLEFSLIEQVYYSVSGIGTCTDTDIVIPFSYDGLPVKAISDYAFDGCTSLTSVNISNSVVSIGNHAFDGCSSLTSVTIGSGVNEIGKYAFNECKSLTEINYNASEVEDLTSSNYIFYHAGRGSDGIMVTIGVNVKNIPAYLFCPRSETISSELEITSVVFEENSICESIGEYAFAACRSLESIIIADSVTSIGDHAFRYCIKLTSITIGENITHIGSWAFNGTGYCDDSANWENGVLYLGNYVLEVEVGLTGDCTIKEGATLIADNGFNLGQKVVSVIIPDSVVIIGYRAFANCYYLTNVTIGSGLKTIGDEAFMQCYYLYSINIPASVTYIGIGAFYNCLALDDVVFEKTSGWYVTDTKDGSSVKSVGFSSDTKQNGATLTLYYNYYLYRK